MPLDKMLCLVGGGMALMFSLMMQWIASRHSPDQDIKGCADNKGYRKCQFHHRDTEYTESLREEWKIRFRRL